MTTINEGHIKRLIALENDKVQEALINHSVYLKVVDDMIYFLSREFRRHDIQACLMLRHALESTCLAAYALFSKPETDECEVMAGFGDTEKAYKWIEKEFPG